MDDKLNMLLSRIKQLEHELLAEMRAREQKLGYEILGTKVRFAAAVAARHDKIAKSLASYLREARLFSILSAPVIWFCIFPVVLLHLVANIYQFICFPIYGIPKVSRKDYIVMDRNRLRYLNQMERFNCLYCEYVNGLLAYVQEIAARTEQYWCPIKHAMSLKTRHSCYQYFMDYGDAEHYRQRIEDVCRDYADLKKM